MASVDAPSSGKLGRYALGRRLAVGGMAEVFEAVDAASGRKVVVKVLLPQLRRDHAFVQMLADEARLTLELSHPNLVRTLAMNTAGDLPYLVMEHVEGCTLSRLLEHGGALPVGLALRIAQDLLTALAYIHGRTDRSGHDLEIVHRDVTPNNVLLSLAGAVKLGDFGIARSARRAARTRTGMIKGTVRYMAPEQLMGDDIDRRADIYGVGLVFFEMLVGAPYIDAPRELDMLRLASEPPWRPPSVLRPDLGASIDALVRPALAHFPEQRYQTAEVMLDAIRRTIAERGLAEADDLGERIRAAVRDDNRPIRSAPSSGDEPRLTEVRDAPSTPPRFKPAPTARRWIALTALVAAGLLGWWWLLRATGPTQTVADSSTIDSGMTETRETRPAARADGARSTIVRHSPAPAADAQTGGPKRTPPLRDSRGGTRTKKPAKPGRRGAQNGVAPEAVGRQAIASVGPMRERLTALRTEMSGKGLLNEDLPIAARQALQRAEVALEQGDVEAAASMLSRAEAAIRATAVDRALVERKLSRADERLRRLPANHPHLSGLREQAQAALEEFMDGRYDRANRLVNRLLDQTR